MEELKTEMKSGDIPKEDGTKKRKALDREEQGFAAKETRLQPALDEQKVMAGNLREQCRSHQGARRRDDQVRAGK